MDFCIADTPEELEQDRILSEISFFLRNKMTFIDLETFEECCLNFLGKLNSINVFTLQAKEYANRLLNLENRVVNLR